MSQHIPASKDETKMTPAQQPLRTSGGVVRLYEQTAARAFDDCASSAGLAEIAARWEHVNGWSAPMRNPLWIEAEGGTPVAAVSGSFDELMNGEVERRRQAIAHAPEDIRALLAIIQEMRAPKRRTRRTRMANQEPTRLTAA